MAVEQAKNRTMQHLQDHVNSLPVLPAVATELMQLNEDADDYFERTLSMANGEPTFATRLLVYANSASIAPRQPIASIREAFRHIGAKRAVDLFVAHV